MKKLIAIALAGVLLTGCAGMSLQIGAGYRKIPKLKQGEQMVTKLSPAEIEAIIALIGSEAFEKLIAHSLPPNERVDLGAWVDLEVGSSEKSR